MTSIHYIQFSYARCTISFDASVWNIMIRRDFGADIHEGLNVRPRAPLLMRSPNEKCEVLEQLQPGQIA